MQQKVGVRFKIGAKIYSFLCDFPVNKGDNVIVETSLGQGFAKVESIDNILENEDISQLKKVLRIATPKDVKQNEENAQKEKEAIQTTKEFVEKMKLDMNVVNAEYSFDGSKVIIDFISEDRVDFRDLVKELATKLKTRIELRQIGIRDQAKMVGGIGICGRVCCCASHLKDFEKVSIKMAKVQGLALNPTKISGACGRLMCCLEYENEYYSEVYPKMPKLNSEVKTPDGVGTVLYTNALKQVASVKITANDGSTTIKDFKFDDIQKLASTNNQSSHLQKEKQDKQKEQNTKKQNEANQEIKNKPKQENTKKEADKNLGNNHNNAKNVVNHNNNTNNTNNNSNNKQNSNFNKKKHKKNKNHNSNVNV